jgi:hypothetical protein
MLSDVNKISRFIRDALSLVAAISAIVRILREIRLYW